MRALKETKRIFSPGKSSVVCSQPITVLKMDMRKRSNEIHVPVSTVFLCCRSLYFQLTLNKQSIAVLAGRAAHHIV